MSTCGIPGCKYPKLTPDGNKSFKCQYWKIAQNKKNEVISKRLSANNDLQVKAMHGDISIRQVLDQLPFNGVLELDSFNNSVPKVIPNIVPSPVMDEMNDDEEPLPTVGNLPIPTQDANQQKNQQQQRKITDDVKTQALDIIQTLESPTILNNRAAVELEKIEKLLRLVIPNLLDVPIASSTPALPDQHQSIIEKDNNLVLSKEIYRNRSKIDELERKIKYLEARVNNKDDQEWLWIANSTPKELQITYNQLITYSKHVRRVFVDDKPSNPCFVVTKDKSIIRYLITMFPGVFWFFSNYKYEKGDKPFDLEEFNQLKFSDIYIVPDFNFIKDENLLPNHVVCFAHESYEFKPKWFPKYCEFEFESYFELKIMEFLDLPEYSYRFHEFSKIQRKANANLNQLEKWMLREGSIEDFTNKYSFYDKIDSQDLN
jgi:hypothetical protein